MNLWLSWSPWAARPHENLESGSGKSGRSLLNPHSLLVPFSLSLSPTHRLSLSGRHVDRHGLSITPYIPLFWSRLSPDPNAQETALGGATSWSSHIQTWLLGIYPFGLMGANFHRKGALSSKGASYRRTNTSFIQQSILRANLLPGVNLAFAGERVT